MSTSFLRYDKKDNVIKYSFSNINNKENNDEKNNKNETNEIIENKEMPKRMKLYE